MRLALALLLALAFSQPDAALRIVVIEGEDAVNVIQQKTAVAPLIEVRDRNNLPVAGATVTFTIGSNTASFAGGVQTLTVATNAAGQAAAAAINPLASGAVQINVAAAFQGQTAVATIAQTNVLTAAQAATAAGASSAGASGGSAGGSGTAAGGAAGGGGISGTTIGIVGAAVAGGALAATQVGGGEDGQTYSGSYTASIPVTSFSPAGIAQCTFIESATGTVTITIDDPATAAGTARVTERHSITGGNCGNIGGGADDTAEGPLSGGPANLTFAVQKTNPLPAGATRIKPWSFVGQLLGNEIAGTLTTGDINNNPNGSQARGSVQVSITLRKTN